jgi:hypothetical protein
MVGSVKFANLKNHVRFNSLVHWKQGSHSGPSKKPHLKAEPLVIQDEESAMKIFDPNMQRERWLRHVLCRRYAAVAFNMIPAPPVKKPSGGSRTFCWAFGSLIKGECEILGAWNLEAASAIPTAVFGDLYVRGVEFVRCGLGDLGDVEAAFVATFRNAALYPSVEQSFVAAIDAVKPRHRAAMSVMMRAALGDAGTTSMTVSRPEISSEDLRQKYPGILDRWGRAVAACHPLFALPEPYPQLVRSVDRASAGIQERLMKAIKRHGRFADSAEAFDFVVDALLRADLRLQRDEDAKELARVAAGSRSGQFALLSGDAVGTPALA